MNTSGFIFFEDELLNGGSVMTRNVDFPEFETVSIKVAKIIGLLLLDFLLEVTNERAFADVNWEGSLSRMTLNKADDGNGVAHH
jgi:hypothetical protein